MDIPDYIKTTENTLLFCTEEELQKVQETLNNSPSVEISTNHNLKDVKAESKDLVFVYYPKRNLTNELASQLINVGKSGSKLIILSEPSDVELLLKVNGFINLKQEGPMTTCEKPSYQLGSSAKIDLKKASAVWKIDDGDDDEELIDSDELLDENDLQKPDPSTLRVCGTTGKRKACKDCSCGLAEELAAEVKSGEKIDTSNAPKSSCGSCYLGDAFRCATCPYLGMPAFKPGEKIQLDANQLKSDL